MKNLIILMVLFFASVVPLRADQTDSDDKEFSSLDNVNNPFNVQPPKQEQAPVASVPVKAPEPVAAAPQPVKTEEEPKAPVLKLEGVAVGEEIRQAVINGQVVSVDDNIEGARVVSVTIDGVGLVFNDKKIFLRVN